MSYYLKDFIQGINDIEIVNQNIDKVSFEDISTPCNGDENSLIWINEKNNNINEIIKNSKASIIIIHKDTMSKEFSRYKKTFVLCSNPKLVFLKIMKKVYKKDINFSISKNAVIDERAEIDNNVKVGPNSYLGRAIVRSGTVIYGNNYIYDNVQIGKNVIIQAGTIIGAEGLGHIKNENGIYENFAHIGGVKILDGVEIGPLTTISSGTINSTIIGENSIIDCHVQIGHNVRIGKNVIITSHSVIGGSSNIGDEVFIGLGAVICDGVTIGNGAKIGPGTVIVSDVMENQAYATRSGFKIRS